MKDKLSPEFEDALFHAGSNEIACEFCHRIHFGSDPTLGEDERKELEQKEKENPDKYIGHSYDMVDWGQLDGKIFVADCPCNSATKYEDFIWKNRYLIMEYLRLKINGILISAEHDMKELTSVKINKLLEKESKEIEL